MDEKISIEASVCFTGYRPGKLSFGYDDASPAYTALAAAISREIELLVGGGMRIFYCGMAQGSDMLCAEALFALRESRGWADVTLRAVLPCAGQWRGWPDDARRRAADLLRGCGSVTLLQREYTPDCMQRRNRYMIDRSAALLAIYDGKPGGTANTVNYAISKGRGVVIIRPDDLQRIAICGENYSMFE